MGCSLVKSVRFFYCVIKRAVESVIKFQASAPVLFGPKNRKKHFIIFITRLNRNPNSRLRLRKMFGSGSRYPKLLGLRLHWS